MIVTYQSSSSKSIFLPRHVPEAGPTWNSHWAGATCRGRRSLGVTSSWQVDPQNIDTTHITDSTRPPNWCHQSWRQHKGKLCSELQWSHEPPLWSSPQSNRMPWMCTLRFKNTLTYATCIQSLLGSLYGEFKMFLKQPRQDLYYIDLDHAFSRPRTPGANWKVKIVTVGWSPDQKTNSMGNFQGLSCSKNNAWKESLPAELPCLCLDISLLATPRAIWILGQSGSTLARSRTRDPGNNNPLNGR